MKTRRPSFFSESEREKKRKRTDAMPIVPQQPQNMLGLPDEMWLEILRYFNKKQLRDVSPTHSFFRNLIAKHKLFEQAPWPIPNYEKLIAPWCSGMQFKKLFFEESTGNHFLNPLKNGDIVAGTKDGRVSVLELGRTEWHEYGQHERPHASPGLHKASANYATLLKSGLLATCGDDGMRLWDRTTRSMTQFFQIPQLGWAAKQDGIHELSTGDLLSSSKTNHFHLWRKTGVAMSSYTYAGEQFGANDDKITKPYLWMCINDIVTGVGDRFITRWDIKNNNAMQRVEISALKQRIALTMRVLRQDDAFAATHLMPEIIDFFNDTADNVAGAEFDFYSDIPDKLLGAGYLMIEVGFFTFLLKPFDETMTPLYIGSVNERWYESTHTDDLLLARNTGQGLETMSKFDMATNKFQAYHRFDSGVIRYILLLPNGHALMTPRQGTPFIFDINSSTQLHDLALEYPDEVDPRETCMMLLKSGDLIGWHYSTRLSMNNLIIWDYQTGRIKNSFLSRGDPCELENGDIMTHAPLEGTDHVSVVRYGVKI